MNMHMKNTLLTLTAFASLGSSLPALAQVQAQSAVGDADTQMLISQIQTDKRAIVLRGLGLSEAELAKFTPLYDQYQAERKGIYDRSADLLNRYAANYATLDDATSKGLLKDYFKLESDKTKLLSKTVKKLEKVLPATKVLRFVQIENKLNTLLQVEAASIVPLAN